MSENEPAQASLGQAGALAEERASGGLGFLGHVNLVFLTYVASAGLAFGVQVLVARALGPHGRGVFGLFLLTASITQSVLGLGMNVSAVYFLGKRTMTLPRVLANSQHVALASGAICSLLVLAAWPLLGDRFVEHGIPYWTFAFVVPVFVSYAACIAVLQGMHRFVAMNAVILTQPVVQFALLAAGVALGSVNTTAAVLFWAGGMFAASALAVGLVWGRALRAELLRIDWPSLREQARFGVRGQLGNISQLLNYRLDQYVVLLFVNAAAVGIYAVAAAVTQSVWFFANAVATVLLPRLTAANRADAARTTPLICRTTLLVSALAAAALAAVSPWLLETFFGHKFRPSLEPLLWLLPGTVALAGSKILASYIFSQGFPGTTSLITIAALVVTLVADFTLIPAFGVNGAAAASTLAYSVHFALSLVAYRRISGSPIWDAVLIRGEDLRRYLAMARERLAPA